MALRADLVFDGGGGPRGEGVYDIAQISPILVNSKVLGRHESVLWRQWVYKPR
jgi:hypothetical protein